MRGRLAVIAVAAILACKFTPGVAPGPGRTDGGTTPDSPMAPDAGPCATLGSSCAGADTHRNCTTSGAVPIDTACVWGCVATPAAHCGVLVPAGGALTGSDLAPNAMLLDPTLNGALDGDTGAISGLTPRMAGSGIRNGIGYTLRNGVAIFTFNSLRVVNGLTIGGSHPVVLAANGMIQIDGALVAQSCTGPASAGGATGGIKQGGEASGSGKGQGTSSGNNGGGGGGYGGSGGDGIGGQAGGASFGSATIPVLAGGGGGAGAGGGGNSGPGGNGGGAVQLVSNTLVTFGVQGSLDASGCGGTEGTGGGDGGGGGGAGGTILLEAPMISIAGSLAVNGGAGGGGPGGGATAGSDGTLGRTQANGGTPGGGSGAAANVIKGVTATGGFGGGGGGAGRMRFNTHSGQLMTTASGLLSPDLTDNPTTTTQGSAQVQ